MKKTERLQMIIILLKENKRLSADRLASYFEVSVRTIYRDIDALSQMKVPIISYEGTSGGYEIDPDYFLPSITLTQREVFLLSLLFKTSEKLNLSSYAEDISNLWNKLNYSCNTGLKKLMPLLHKIDIDISGITSDRIDPVVFETVLESLSHSRRLEIQYHTIMENRITKRSVSPIKLFYWEGCWYLKSYCHLREQVRVFRLDRINSAIVIDMSSIDFDGEALTNGEPLVHYEIHINEHLYSLIKGDMQMKDIKIKALQNGILHVDVLSGDSRYFEAMAYRNPTLATFISPPEFIHKLKNQLHTLSDIYLK